MLLWAGVYSVYSRLAVDHQRIAGFFPLLLMMCFRGTWCVLRDISAFDDVFSWHLLCAV